MKFDLREQLDKFRRTDDSDPVMTTNRQQVTPVTGDDVIRIPRDRAFDHLVVTWVIGDHLQNIRDFNRTQETAIFFHSLVDIIRCYFKLCNKHSLEFIHDPRTCQSIHIPPAESCRNKEAECRRNDNWKPECWCHIRLQVAFTILVNEIIRKCDAFLFRHRISNPFHVPRTNHGKATSARALRIVSSK